MTRKLINVGFIGCGLIGNKRAKELNKKQILGCFDTNEKNLKIFSKRYKCKKFTNVKSLISDDKIDALFISTYHNSLAKYLKLSINSGKNVLVEKPGGKNYKELETILKKKNKKKILIHVGYNHRYHPSIIKAKDIIKKKIIGDLLYIRARYGHGARLNYHNEWRMKRKLSGGGELIDQGAHLIDLSRMFLGEFNKVEASLRKFYWKAKGQVDDNAFLTLTNKKNKVAFLHCSCTEWKNKFSFEIFGSKGKIDINGLGRSYGTEKLNLYIMKKKLGKPKMRSWKYYGKDNSWKLEIKKFLKTFIKIKTVKVV